MSDQTAFEPPIEVDVLVCGAGPVGLLLGYMLARMKVDTFIVEKYSKEVKHSYGRAVAYYPRSLELLDQLDLLDEIVQVGFIGRSSVTFKDGDRVTSRGFHTMFNYMRESYLDCVVNLRQKHFETIVLKRCQDLGVNVHYCWKLKAFKIVEDGSRVLSTVEDSESGSVKYVKSKYLIGADGSSSTVRRLAGIHFEKDSTSTQWIRLDGMMRTNMPDTSLGLSSIESPSHGNVLWCGLDRGATRLGFAFSKDMYAKYKGNITQDEVVDEAKKAVAPFSLEVDTVDWWTIYSIKQGVADCFTMGNILLAGDACHVHSSGTAQGLNTGIHDAVNLGWKLGGVIQGWYDRSIIDTYNAERRPIALKLIRLDKAFSSLLSGTIPENHSLPVSRQSETADPNELFAELWDKSLGFTTGLGIQYDENKLNQKPNTGNIQPGARAPDTLVYPPGSRFPTRLFQLTKNNSAFWILVFTGVPQVTRPQIASARAYIDSAATFTNLLVPRFQFLTIIGGTASLAEKALDGHGFGNAYYDPDLSAHSRYSVSEESGAVVILRPDGIYGFATTLDKIEEIGAYFAGFANKK